LTHASRRARELNSDWRISNDSSETRPKSCRKNHNAALPDGFGHAYPRISQEIDTSVNWVTHFFFFFVHRLDRCLGLVHTLADRWESSEAISKKMWGEDAFIVH